MALNIESLKKKTVKAIEKLPDLATVVRPEENSFNEQSGYTLVAQIRGQYYRGSFKGGRNTHATLNVTDPGQTTRKFPEKFMTVIDSNTSQIRLGDLLDYGGCRYTITDLGTNIGVYFDLSLERV